MSTNARREADARANRIARFASIPLLLALWQLVSGLQIVNPVLFPSPLVVAQSLWDYLARGEGWTDLGTSLVRVLIGYTAGALAGIGVGLLTGSKPFFANLLTPAIQILRPIPPIAFVPMVIVWFGLSEWGKWFLVAWGVFFAVWLATHMGVRRVNENLTRAALSLGESPAGMLWSVQLPAAAPTMLVGLRTAVSIAFYTLVAAELAGAFAGIAYRLDITQQNMQIGHTMAGLVLLGVVSAFADFAFERTAARVVHWSS